MHDCWNPVISVCEILQPDVMSSCTAVAWGSPPPSSSSILSSDSWVRVVMTGWANPASNHGGTAILTITSLNMSQMFDLAAFRAFF